MRMSSRKILFVCACVVLIGFEGYELHDVVARRTPSLLIQGEQRILIPEFGDGAPVLQAFGMMGDGLRAVSVQLSTDRPVTLRVLCELRQMYEDTPGAHAEIYRWTTTLSRVSGTEWRRIDFPPLAASDGRFYGFRFQLLETQLARGRAGRQPTSRTEAERARVGIAASADNVRRGGVLWIGETRQIGSLFFQAHGKDETTYERFRLTFEPKLPRPLQNRAVQISIVIASNWALLAFTYAMLVGNGAPVIRPILAAALLLVVGVTAHVPAIRADRSLAAQIALTGDSETRDDRRFEALTPFLPPAGRIGYLQPADWPSTGALRLFYLAQYSLAPRIVVIGTEPQLLIVVPETGIRAETAAADSRLAAFTLVRRLPDGMLVFRRVG